jgi:O-antigen/teichoic acid export membrane protein
VQDKSADTASQDDLDTTELEQGTQTRMSEKQPSSNFKGRTLANSTAVILGWLIPTAIFMVLTPYLIKSLGKEAYGILALTNVLTGYVSFMNLGFGEAVTKHTAQYAAIDDWNNLTRTVSAGLIIFTAIGLLGGILILTLSDWLANSVFNIPPELSEATLFVFRLAGLGFFLNMFTALLEGLAMGMNHFEIPNTIRIIRVSLSSLLMVLAMIAGRGLPGVMAGNILGQAVATAASSFVTFRLVPRPRLRGAVSHIPELFAFGKFVILSRGINTVTNQIGSTALGIFSTMTALTYFEIPTRIVQFGMEVFQRLFEQLFPLSAGLDSQGKRELLTRIFVSIIWWQIVLVLPVFLLVLFFGRFALQFWIGQDFVNNSYSILIVTAVYQIVSVLTAVPFQYALGLGRPDYPTWFSLARLVLVGAVIYPLVRLLGALGVALALLIGEGQGMFFVFFIARRLLGLNLWAILRRDMFKMTALLLAFVALWAVVGDTLNAYPSLLLQVGAAIVLLAFYFAGAMVLGVLPLEQARRLLTRKFWKTA